MSLFLRLLAVLLAMSTQADYTGLWYRVDSRSDDPQERIEAAVRGFVEKNSRGRTTAEDLDPQTLKRLRTVVETFVQYADELYIELDDDELVIDDGGPRIRIFYLDDLEHERQMPDGTRLETRAVRAGNQIRIAQESSDDAKLFETYVLSSDGDEMTLTATLEDDQLKSPLVIKSIYTRADE